ncbi:MAG: tetratricopeptide repeat protein [Bryobacteraceae bacterium]|jgi:Flp pilus assembly protein TadD
MSRATDRKQSARTSERRGPAAVKAKSAARASGRAIDFAVVVLLVAGVFLAYGQTLHFGFVNFDDPDYVTGNIHVRAGITADSVAWAFRHSFAGNWFPLTWISHMLDVALFGLDGGLHHLTGVSIHALAAVLLFVLLRRITGARWPSAMVAALFALHPLHVESVAWIAERKDVLSAFFWMLALYAYAAYAARPGPARYALTLLAFCFGLMAKPMLVTLPLVLVLLDYWPLARGLRLLEKLPFLALSAVASVVTFIVHGEAGATASVDILPIAVRLENALVSYAIYAVKMFSPSNLAVFYPYPRGSLTIPATLAAVALAAVTFLAIRMASRRPYLIVGWGWYLVTLAPVIGVIQVGGQARADRYTYIPTIGLSIMLVWGAAEILQPWPRARAVLACSVAVACIVLTRAQVRYWQDGVTLFRHAIDVTADNYVARFNLAFALDTQGETAEAARQLAEAVRIRPNSAPARAELGQLLAKQGQLQEALLQLDAAVRLDPSDATVHYRRGSVLGATGRETEAAAEFLETVRLDPGNANAHYDLGISLADQGKNAEAVSEFAAAVRLSPNDASAHYNLGITLGRVGRTRESIEQLSEAIKIDPNLPGARDALEDAKRLQRATGK